MMNIIITIINSFYKFTEGEVSKTQLIDYSHYILELNRSDSVKHRYFVYMRNFLTYLAKSRDCPEILSLKFYIEKPKTRKTIKLLTTRIITPDDIKNLIDKIEYSTLPSETKNNYKTLILFLAYSGQRVMTVSRLTAGQFRDALCHEPPVLTVKACQDKIRLEHYVPLHPTLIPFIEDAIAGKDDNECVFNFRNLQRWVKSHPVPLLRTKGHIVLKDLRKAFEQISDSVGFEDANKNFIMSHGVGSINWQSYKQFLPSNVYDRYYKFWGNVSFSDNQVSTT